MNHASKFFLSVLTILLLAGCASHRYTVIEPAKQSFRDFSTLEIPQFKSNLTDPGSAELARKFAGRLHTEIMDYRTKHPEEILFDDVVLATGDSEGVLVLDGTIISYEEGSRAKRYWIGFGSGKAYCTIQARLVNKATGEEVARTNFDGELMGGMFGGEADSVIDGVVKAFLDYMTEYMSS